MFCNPNFRHRICSKIVLGKKKAFDFEKQWSGGDNRGRRACIHPHNNIGT